MDVDSDTTDIKCDDSGLKEWEKAWCASSVPKGDYLTKTQNALDNIETRGPKCAAIAQKGKTLLSNSKLRFYANP